jgi:hypothetical protein
MCNIVSDALQMLLAEDFDHIYFEDALLPTDKVVSPSYTNALSPPVTLPILQIRDHN